MVELVDTLDLKSDAHKACGFDSRSAHHRINEGFDGKNFQEKARRNN